MKIIVGFGNPGKKFENTRHNVGFMVMDKLAKKLAIKEKWNESKRGKLKYLWTKLKGEKVELVKPMTFMNNSGYAVAYIKRKHPKLDSADLFVVHDDLDIELGQYKIQFGKGPRDHGGVNSIEHHLKTKDFWRVRVGVENRKGEPHFAKATRGEDYVLGKFGKKEKEIIDGVIEEIIDELLNICL